MKEQTERLTVQSVPASVSRTQVIELLATLGIDALDVVRGGVLIGLDAIRCEVMARDPDGEWYVAEDGESMAVHEVCIPIVDER